MQIKIVRKKIRSIRLSVKADGQIVCSAPVFESEEKIRSFIESKKQWLEKTVVKVSEARQNSLFIKEDSLAFAAGFTVADRQKNGRNFVYSARWKRYAFNVFEHTAGKMLANFKVGMLPPFELKGRSMHSMWGNCNTKTNVITLNWELLNFPQSCVDYVVFHEMTHFLYIYHDRNFYAYINRYMPDYKEAVKKMK